MSQARIKPLHKLLAFAALIFVLVLGFRTAVFYGWVPRPNALKTVIPLRAEQIHAEVLNGSAAGIKTAPLASGTTIARVSGPKINYEIWAWNAQMGLIYANGGPETTSDSAMARHNVHVLLKRQDDTSQMQADLLTFASALHDGQNNPQVGAHFINIMGDGAAQFFAALNPKLEKLGPEYHAEIVGSHGYSRGEDGFWGLPAWKSSPQSAKGALVAGVLRDGDWNIAMDWASRNSVPNNPDDKTYDPDALNWVNADSYTKAAELYVQEFCEDLPLKGKPRETKHVCVNGVVTWTPGDVTIAQKRGGLAPLLTTRQNAFQMPCVMIGIHKWDQAHREAVSSVLAASFEAADQIRTNPRALEKAGQFSAAVYKEQSPDYWVKYYKGDTEPDAQHVTVPLGGSAVSNLADNLQLFGLANKSGNIMKATYETFGNIVVQQYPNLVPSYPKLAEVEDTSFLQAMQRSSDVPAGAPEDVNYSASAPMKEIGGRRSYSIQFRPGSAEILPSSYPVLNDIYSDVLMTNMAIAIHGHSDATGDQQSNLALSRERAESVKRYLQAKAPTSFPDGRVRVYAHGQEESVASNSTRQVQIVLGTLQ